MVQVILSIIQPRLLSTWRNKTPHVAEAALFVLLFVSYQLCTTEILYISNYNIRLIYVWVYKKRIHKMLLLTKFDMAMELYSCTVLSVIKLLRVYLAQTNTYTNTTSRTVL